jgi:hypothetical protein
MSLGSGPAIYLCLYRHDVPDPRAETVEIGIDLVDSIDFRQPVARRKQEARRAADGIVVNTLQRLPLLPMARGLSAAGARGPP